jgi:hypothetical protein
MSIQNSKQAWGEQQRADWLAEQSVKRSYKEEVLNKIEALKNSFEIQQYGELSYQPARYPLYVIKSRNWIEENPTVLITGGVHGYETSGVQGALRFLETGFDAYSARFNFVVAPCVSPWGYETINRWNANAVDPNRSFYQDSPAEESANLMKYVASLGVDFIAHFDLHETTDTDNTVFRPALASRDAVEVKDWEIPDGFYAVGDTNKPADDFQTAIIESVAKVTHIAPADSEGKIIGAKITQNGVINYATTQLGLCTGFSGSQYSTTTEVYPDSPKLTDEICILAQLAAVTGGLNYILQKDNKRP